MKCVGCYIVAGFFAVELAWFLSCRPFVGYWALPVPMGKKSFFFEGLRVAQVLIEALL